MLKQPVPLTKLLLATALASSLSACSTIGDLVGTRDRNDYQVVDGQRRKPVLNPSAASQLGGGASVLRYDGYVPPSYAAEPVQAPPVTYSSPNGAYYNVPLPNVSPVSEAPRGGMSVPPEEKSSSTWGTVKGWFGVEEKPNPNMSMQNMAYTKSLDAADALHTTRKPFPRHVEAVPAYVAPSPAVVAPEPVPALAPVSAPVEKSEERARQTNTNININTHSVRASQPVDEHAYNLLINWEWVERLLGLNAKPSLALMVHELVLASSEYPDLQRVPQTPPALGEARSQAPFVRHELQTDGTISGHMKKTLNDDVEADRPNSLLEEMERNAPAGGSVPDPAPLIPVTRPGAHLPPPLPRGMDASLLPDFMPQGRSAPEPDPELQRTTALLLRKEQPMMTIAARGTLIDTWYVPAASVSVCVMNGAIEL
jgi:hypothetical protein